MDALDAHRGAQAATELARFLNLTMEERKPWGMIAGSDEKTDILSIFAESLRHLALMLLPIVPHAAQAMSRQLGVPYAETMLSKDFVLNGELTAWGGCGGWSRIGEPAILFPRVEE